MAARASRRWIVMAAVAGAGVLSGGAATAQAPPGPVSAIGGTITTPFGDGWAGARVQLTGTDSVTGQPVELTTRTAGDGTYSFQLSDPGTYAVTPAVTAGYGADEYAPTQCEGGTPLPDACQAITISAGQRDTEDFTAGYLLAGSVAGRGGAGAAGVTLHLSDREQGAVRMTTAETDSQGSFTASLPPGEILVTAEPHGHQTFAGVAGGTCRPAASGCEVSLRQDRSIELCAAIRGRAMTRCTRSVSRWRSRSSEPAEAQARAGSISASRRFFG